LFPFNQHLHKTWSLSEGVSLILSKYKPSFRHLIYLLTVMTGLLTSCIASRRLCDFRLSELARPHTLSEFVLGNY